MGRTNLDPIMTFPDGSHLLIAPPTQKKGAFHAPSTWRPSQQMIEAPSASYPTTSLQPLAWLRKKTPTAMLNVSTRIQLSR